jgi:transposase InsO family protein
MPWKVETMSELRLAFVHEVLHGQRPVAATCRKYGTSRKTGYKWLGRYRQQPDRPLRDRPRAPRRSPRRLGADLEAEVLEVRDQFGWGAFTIWHHLRNRAAGHGRPRRLPCPQAVGNILRRHGRTPPPPAAGQDPPPCFQRGAAHQLWQCDFKGALEGQRRKLFPLTVLDDHSRCLLALRLCPDVTRASAWAVLWEVFGAFGLPEELLTDNAFGTQFPHRPGLSWFEARLIRLGIRPRHGRAYHPQTQGKVGRLHGTWEREVGPHLDRSGAEAVQAPLDRWRRQVDNAVRPHEALDGRPPLSRFTVNRRRRPERLPEVAYAAGSQTRKVDAGGDISWRGCRILVGCGIAGERVRVEERGHEVAVYYCHKQIRSISTAQLQRGKFL